MVVHCKVGWRWDKEVGCKASVDHNTTQEKSIPSKEGFEGFRRPQSETGSLQEDAGHLSPRETLGIFVAFFVLVIFIFVLVVFTTVWNCVSREQIVEQYIVDWLKPRKT